VKSHLYRKARLEQSIKKEGEDMKKRRFIILGFILVFIFTGTALAQKGKKAYETIQWNKPTPISQRIGGEAMGNGQVRMLG
jgi:hypothetical protein